EPRLIAVVHALTGFVFRLEEAAKAASGTMTVGRVPSLVREVLAGRSDVSALEQLLSRIGSYFGRQMQAFQDATDRGAKELLKDIAPMTIATEATNKQRGVFAGVFHKNDCWDLYEAKHRSLRNADDLFEKYFAQELEAAIRRLLSQTEKGQGGGS